MPGWDEGRKRVLLIAASILAARRLAPYEGGIRTPATVSAVADAIRWAEHILNEIDKRWPDDNREDRRHGNNTRVAPGGSRR